MQDIKVWNPNAIETEIATLYKPSLERSMEGEETGDGAWLALGRGKFSNLAGEDEDEAKNGASVSFA